MHFETAKCFFSSIGLFWLITEVLSYFIKDISQNLINLGPVFLVFSFGYTFVKRRPVISVSHKVANTDVTIEIKMGDIFDVNGSIVVGVNNSFDTTVNEVLVSSKSLDGKFISKFYDNATHIDSDIKKALTGVAVKIKRTSKVNGKREIYPIGTVAMLRARSKTAYLLAISEFNEDGVATSTFENLQVSIASLWNFIATKGSLEDITIPVLGTGHARIKNKREEIIREIVRSFLAALSEKRFTNKLTICIDVGDYYNQRIDLIELGRFLEYSCKYSEINPVRPVVGEPIN